MQEATKQSAASDSWMLTTVTAGYINLYNKSKYAKVIAIALLLVLFV